MTKLLTILLTIASLTAFSQSAEKILHNYFSDFRAGKYPAIPQEVIKQENAKAILKVLSIYWNDSLSQVRGKANSITRTIGIKSKQSATRQECVLQLVRAGRDKDSGNVGSAFGYLKEFNKNDFTAVAKDSLRNLFNSKPPHFDKLIKLIGFLEVTDLQPQLQSLSQQTDAAKSDRWAAQLALARMGDRAMMQNIIERVKKIPVNDDVVYEIFPDLIYTRQLDAISYLTRVLFSDENNCRSADAEHGGKIPCAYRVMEQLAPVVEGYPLVLDESGDVKTKDYEGALKKVREWFRAQKDYKIKRDTY